MLKENCYFYIELQNTGVRCTRYTQIGKCHCDDCDRFLDKADARKIIKKYSDGELIPIDNIKQEIFNAIDNVPLTLSRDNADKLLKADIQNIIDKHLKQKTGMTMEEIDKAVEKIREHCCNNNCRTCRARSIHGCVFMSGYPNEWITVEEADMEEDK